ncbi:MAG: hypothetical protein EBZ55_05865, partial [Actinobacteria bacterium]|nr:hypothetical protein [Actinomycetota bacterium]
ADLVAEKKLHLLMRSVLKESGIRAVHDIGEGGILWALAEMTFGVGSAGAEVDLKAVSGERAEEALRRDMLVQVARVDDETILVKASTDAQLDESLDAAGICAGGDVRVARDPLRA